MAPENLEVRSIVLPPGDTVKLRAAGGDSIRVFAGEAWITLEGETHDWFVARGDSLRVPGRGAVVIEALSTVALCTQPAHRPLRLLERVWAAFGRAGAVPVR
jgi:quercetin dioxygenase-like cupin family protein